jgi:hypothetical protein
VARGARRFAGADCPDCGEWSEEDEWCAECRRCVYCCTCEHEEDYDAEFDSDEMGEDPEEAADYTTDVGRGASGGGLPG